MYNKDLSRHTLVSQAASGDMLMVENMQLRLRTLKRLSSSNHHGNKGLMAQGLG